MWRFPRARIPADIKSGAPRWKSWGTPFAAFDGSTCDTRTYFKNQMLTFVRVFPALFNDELETHASCPSRRTSRMSSYHYSAAHHSYSCLSLRMKQHVR